MTEETPATEPTDETEPKTAHATRPDNIGKNWDGSPLKDPDHEQLASQAEDNDEEQMVYLPQLIASEFAIQEHSARDMVLLGEVSIDGKTVQSNRGWFAYSDIVDKDITVKSDVKSVRFHYAG